MELRALALSHPRKTIAIAACVGAVGLASLAFPSVVRWRLDAAAARRNLDVAAREIHAGWFGVELVDVRAAHRRTSAQRGSGCSAVKSSSVRT